MQLPRLLATVYLSCCLSCLEAGAENLSLGTWDYVPFLSALMSSLSPSPVSRARVWLWDASLLPRWNIITCWGVILLLSYWLLALFLRWRGSEATRREGNVTWDVFSVFSCGYVLCVNCLHLYIILILFFLVSLHCRSSNVNKYKYIRRFVFGVSQIW